jgi:hypothetical protein
MKINREARIVVLNRDCPFQSGSKAEKEFTLILKSKTVAEYREKSKGDVGYLYGLLRRKNIRLSGKAAR